MINVYDLKYDEVHNILATTTHNFSRTTIISVRRIRNEYCGSWAFSGLFFSLFTPWQSKFVGDIWNYGSHRHTHSLSNHSCHVEKTTTTPLSTKDRAKKLIEKAHNDRVWINSIDEHALRPFIVLWLGEMRKRTRKTYEITNVNLLPSARENVSS